MIGKRYFITPYLYYPTMSKDQLVDCDLQQAERTALNRKIFETKLVRNKGTKF